MADKPKVAFYWCASCGGCEEAVVDLADQLLEVVEAVEIGFWPVALDFKRKDVENFKKGELLASFINGSIRLSEQQEMVELLRDKSQNLIAFGSCSHLGGIPGLANLWDKESIFQRLYKETPTLEEAKEPIYPQEITHLEEGDIHLPAFFDSVNTLDQTVDVDYYLPGCAPTPNMVMEIVTALLEGSLPPKGSVIGPHRALCDECDLKESKPDKMLITEIKRTHETVADPEECFLAQGIICMGPATRGGCEARCIKANMPCTGCFGPTDKVMDQGGKMLSALASIIDYETEEELQAIIEKIPDPVGTFYRYSLPSSLLGQKRIKTGGEAGG